MCQTIITNIVHEAVQLQQRNILDTKSINYKDNECNMYILKNSLVE